MYEIIYSAAFEELYLFSVICNFLSSTVENRAAEFGKVILLNGASSSGKSSIALALQARIEEPFWHISIDHLRDAGVLPLERIRSGEFRWQDMREAFFDGFDRSLAAYVRAGNNLIVQHIIETKAWMQRLIILLKPYDVFFAGIHRSLEELKRRELARGDRRIEDTCRDYHSIHLHAQDDLELDSTLPPGVNAEKLILAWGRRKRPSALERLTVE